MSRTEYERHSVERKLRLQYIEAMYVVTGSIKREDICYMFSVAEACASRDMRRYHQLNKDTYLNHRNKTWTVCDDFKPVAGLLHMPHLEFIKTLKYLLNQ